MEFSRAKIAMLQSSFTEWLIDSDPQFFNNKCILFESKEFETAKDLDFALSDLKNVEAALELWSPVFMRRIASWHKHEIIKKSLCFQILIWKERLEKFDCKIALFETAASHHLETLSFEIACDLIGIRKIFLSHTSFTGRLIPICQIGSYANRSILDIELSDWSLDKQRMDLHSNFWKSRTSLQNRQETWFVYFYFVLLGKSLRTTLKLMWLLGKGVSYQTSINTTSQTLDSKLADIFGYRVCDEYRIYRTQISALKFLKRSNRLSEKILAKESFINSDRQVFILYANFQPESSSFPLGGTYTSHIDVVLRIREKFPDAQIFYIEHPHVNRLVVRGSGSRVGLARSIQYYKILQRLGCYILSSKSSYATDLKLSCGALHVTISGNIAIERALRGQITLIAGCPWFKGLPGTILLDDFISGSNFDNVAEDNLKSLAQAWILSVHNKKTLAQPDWSILNKERDKNEAYFEDLKTLVAKLTSTKIVS